MKTRVRVVLSLVVVLAALYTTSCGHYVCSTTFGAGSCTPSGGGLGQGGNTGNAFFYFLDDNQDNSKVGMGLEQLSFSTSSSSSAPQYSAISNFVEPPLPTVGATDGGMVVVNKKFMYVTFFDGTLYGYSIGATGALTSVVSSPSDHYTVQGGNSITADPAGNFIFVGDWSTNVISTFAVNQTDGTLTALGNPVNSGVFPVQLVTDGSGKFLYVTEGQGGTQVAVLSITQGVLSPIVNSPFALNMGEMSGEPSGKFMLGITQDTSGASNKLFVFGIGVDGSLTQVSGSPFTTNSSPVNFVVHPNGAWVYTFNLDSLDDLVPMEGYSLSSTGTLTFMQSYAGVLAGEGQFEQSGKYLFGISEIIVSGTAQFDSQPITVDTSNGTLSIGISPGGFPAAGSFVVTDSAAN